MVTIQGSYNTAVCYTPELEEAARKQIQAVCDQAEFAGCKIRIMPDVHAGKGCTIGTTMTIRDKIVPGMVGVDIGCGMETVELREREIDFEKLDALIRKEIPYGREVRDDLHALNAEIDLILILRLCIFPEDLSCALSQILKLQRSCMVNHSRKASQKGPGHRVEVLVFELSGLAHSEEVDVVPFSVIICLSKKIIIYAH